MTSTNTNSAPNSVDSTHFRSVLGSYCSGITVVTAHTDDQLIGLACQSFFSVSLDAPLIAFSPSTASTSDPRIQGAGRFAVNILGHDQQAISEQFARRGADKWSGIEYTIGTVGAPLLAGVVGTIECTLEAEHPAGDHYLVVGRVHAIS
jgi:3-hydroxy-9,10-secoandrosta-1,3,5(10)-triene-9,17-dione monooxygenase reductase component